MRSKDEGWKTVYDGRDEGDSHASRNGVPFSEGELETDPKTGRFS